MALSRRVVGPDLVHHSDRGSQYASGDYTDLLKENGIAISMSRKGNPWDNAACESFMKTRLAMCHPQSSKPTSSDNKRKPLRDRFLDEFFQASGNLSIRVIRSVRERLHCRPRPHRLDEFPVGYSSAGCSPTEPASASPTDPHSALQSSCRSSTFNRTVNSVLTACLSSGSHPNNTLHVVRKGERTVSKDWAAFFLENYSHPPSGPRVLTWQT